MKINKQIHNIKKRVMPRNPKKNMWGNSSPLIKGELTQIKNFPPAPENSISRISKSQGQQPWPSQWIQTTSIQLLSTLVMAVSMAANVASSSPCGDESFRVGHELGEFSTWFCSDLRAHKTAPCQNGQNYIQLGLFVYTNVLESTQRKSARMSTSLSLSWMVSCVFSWELSGCLS